MLAKCWRNAGEIRVSITLLVKMQSSSGGRSCVRSGDFDVEPLTREAAFSKGVLRRGQSAPPLHPGMVSLHEEQTTLETGGMDRRSQPSSSADERGRLVAAREEPRPIQSCETKRIRRPTPSPSATADHHNPRKPRHRGDRSEHTDSRRATHITARHILRGNLSVEFCQS